MQNIIERHGLVIANGLDRCDGVITRKRVTKDGIEENDLKENLVSLTIDEKREHVITKYTKTKHGGKRTESDHNVLNIETKFYVK